MRKNNSLLKPTTEEAIIVLYRGEEYSVREIREMIKTSFNRIYKVIPAYVEENQPMFFPKLSEEQFIEVEKFLKNSKTIFNIINM
jgi:transposase